MCGIERLIGLGWAAFEKFRSILRGERPLTRKVFEQCIASVITYRAETLTLTKKSYNKLRVAQRSMVMRWNENQEKIK